jgi:hypothetical protein
MLVRVEWCGALGRSVSDNRQTSENMINSHGLPILDAGGIALCAILILTRISLVHAMCGRQGWPATVAGLARGSVTMNI